MLFRSFQNLLSLTKTQSGLIQTAFFIAYLLVALPAAKLIRRVGYQKGILIGLVILAFMTWVRIDLVSFLFGDILAVGADRRIHQWRFVSRETPALNPVVSARFAHDAARRAPNQAPRNTGSLLRSAVCRRHRGSRRDVARRQLPRVRANAGRRG